MLTPAQEARKEAMYENAAKAWHAYEEGGAVLAAHNAEYDELVAAQLADLGANAPCYHTDPSLWTLFSDSYKSENGIRPSWPMARDEVQDWLRRNEYTD
jgi:hypothetical protein